MTVGSPYFRKPPSAQTIFTVILSSSKQEGYHDDFSHPMTSFILAAPMLHMPPDLLGLSFVNTGGNPRRMPEA